MASFLRLLAFVSLCSLAQVQAREVTVSHNASEITYGGGAVPDGSLCKYENGEIVPAQPGCYNIQPQPPCTQSASISQQDSSFASWKFKRSALLITSLLTDISPVFNVEIDGKIHEADGGQLGKDSRAFTCFTLFTVDGLDPKVEHTVNLTVKGASPSGKTTDSGEPIVGPFSLINYTYTASEESESTSAGNSTTGSGNGNGNGAEHLRFSGAALLMSTLALYIGLH